MNRKIGAAPLLSILTGLNLFHYLDRYVLNAVRTPLAADFGVSYGDSGRLFTAFMIGYFVTSPFFGYLGDRISRKGLIILGIFVWSIGTVLTGFAQGFTMLLCFRVLVGVGEASYATISPGLISDTWRPAKRNNALTIFYVAIPVGSAIGYILGGVIEAHWGWRSAFFWAGAPGLLLALILFPFREPERGESDENRVEARVKPGLKDILGLFGNADFNLIIWGYVAYTFALGAFAFWGPTFLEQVHGLSTLKADNFFGVVIVVAGLAGTLLGGFAATLWQRRNHAGYALMLAGSVFFAAPVSFFALTSSNRPLAMGLLAISIFFLFLCTGPVNTLILETVPVNLRSSSMALSIFMIHLFGDMWSPEIIGRLADSMNGDLKKATLILPGVLLINALLWLVLALKTLRAGKSA
ncbi:MAG TPA: MFS transporter [Syntrophorhabdaceae bacterium]|nr:MFS transporter [Syntrophorhabdaceae bacterium]